MARRLTVEIVGSTEGLEKSYRRAEQGTKRFGQSMEKAGRGAVVASVGFRGLGRAVGFASASFIGGAGLTYAITSTIKAAEESQRVLGQTRNAVIRSGLSWAEYGQQIRDASLATSKLSGFDDEQLLGTFSNLVRRTGDVNKALKLNALAANVARGRSIDLEAAQQLVLKASIGNVSALRRLGINLDKNATSLQALDLLQRRYAGSAAAYGRTAAGAQDRFRVAVQNLQESVGQQLLPTITKYLNTASEWLNNTENQEKVTKDVAAAVKLLTDAADAATPALKKLGEAMQFAADHSSGLDKALKFALGLPNIFDAATFAVDNFGKAWNGVTQNVNDARVAVGAFIHDIGQGGFGSTRSPLLPRQTVTFPRKSGPDPFADARPLPKPGPGASVQERNAFFDNRIARMLDRVQDITSLRGRIARLREISGLIQKRHDATKDITRRLSLEDQLAQIARDILGDQAAIADKDAAAALRAKQAQEKAAKAEKAAQQASLKRATDRVAAINKAAIQQEKSIAAFGATIRKQERAEGQARGRAEQRRVFGILGLTATGEDRAPSRGNLLASLQKAQTAIAGGPLDSKAMQGRLTQLRHVLNSEFSKLTRDTKMKVQEFLDALAGKDKGGPATRRQAASIGQLTAGTGLAGAALRRLEFNLAGAHLTSTPTGIGGRAIHVHTTVNLDGRQVARNTTEHQTRDQRRRPTQTRGRQ